MCCVLVCTCAHINSISDYPKAIFNTVANRCTAAVTILLIAKAAIKVLLILNYIYSSALKKDRENSLTSISKIKNNDGIKKYKFVLGEMTQIFFTSNESSY